MSKLSLIEHLMAGLQDAIAIIRDRDAKLEEARDTIELLRAQLTKKEEPARSAAWHWVAAVDPRTAHLGNQAPEHLMNPYQPDPKIVAALAEERTPAELYASITDMVSKLDEHYRKFSTSATEQRLLFEPLRYLMMYGATLAHQAKNRPQPRSGARIGLELLQRSRELAFAASTYWTKTSEHFEKISEPEDGEEDCEIPDDYFIPDNLKAFWFSVEMAVANANDVIRRTDKLVNTGMWSVQDGGPPWQVVQPQKSEPEDSALAFEELMSVWAIPDNIWKVKGRNKRIRTMLDVMSHKEITDHAYHLQFYLERELRKMEGLLESKPLTINLAKDLVSRLKQLRTAWMKQFDTAHEAFIRSSVIAELALGLDVCKKAKTFMGAVVGIYDVQAETHEFEDRDDIDIEAVLPPKLYKPYAELEEVRTKFLAHARLKKANKKK